MPVPSTSSLGSFAKSPLLSFATSSIGRKWIVALTGLGLLGFVMGHLVGNLQFFLPDKEIFNNYAAKLQSLGPLLWIIRLGLLFIFVVHIITTIALVIENRKARPAKYSKVTPQKSTAASRWMALSGITVLCFVIYHVLHFTLIVFHPVYKTLVDPAGHPDVYSRMILGFSNPAISAFYILGVALLGMHLKHGISSSIQTLGIKSRPVINLVDNGGKFLSIAIALGFISIPVSVLLHLQGLPSWSPLH
ncbi:MAG: succinate dehydrogenase cytochrome b subunit [Chthoniobacterales bacterium]